MTSLLSSGDASYAAESSGPETDNNNNNSDNNNYCGKVNPFQSTEFLDALEDVHTRFILNLPPEELDNTAKIFFQAEQAWWFYEDWICDSTSATDLPRFSHLKPFAQKLFDFSPILPAGNFNVMWSEFSQYKRKISNYGCILLNSDCTKLVLCQVWNGKSWSFPSGKINQGETGVEAATRETYEETGFDPHCLLGSTRTWLTNTSNIPWNYPLQEHDALAYQEADDGKRRTCYVCCGVPEDFPFEPVCRKEVSRVEWFPLDQIPKPNFAVAPFLSQLKRWIKKYKKVSPGNNSSQKKNKKYHKQSSRDRGYHTPRRGGECSDTPKSSGSRPGSRQGSRSRSTVHETDALVAAGLANAGDLSGWSEEDMFQRNEQLLGRKIEYDGNPHQFAEQGFFGGQDPHAFHVVGGRFLNGISSLAPPPQQSKLQPLFHAASERKYSDEHEDLQPFFSDDGVTPWGDIVTEATTTTITTMAATPARTIPAVTPRRKPPKEPPAVEPPDDHDTSLDLFTDAEITRRSQATKLANPVETLQRLRHQQFLRYQADMEYIQAWVAKLPKPKPTPQFGTFHLDAHAMVERAMLTLSS